jgi:hypothetical protein
MRFLCAFDTLFIPLLAAFDQFGGTFTGFISLRRFVKRPAD